MAFKKWLSTYKPQDIGAKAAAGDRLLILIGFFAVIGGIALVISILLADSRIVARVPFQTRDWHTAFIPSEFCKKNGEVAENCLASPKNATLWESNVRRGSKTFKDTFEQTRPIEYWLGAVVHKEELKKASRAQATVMLFAPVHGSADIFVDGVFQTRHRYLDQSLPIQVSIPDVRLAEARDLHIAIRVAPYPFYAVSRDTSIVGQEGFFDPVSADRLMRWQMFFGITRHLIALGIFLVFARILWTVSAGSRGAYDYIAGAQFALVMALISMASVDLMYRVVIVNDYYRIYFLLMVWEAVFLVRLTLSFLRATRHFVLWQLALFALGSVAVYMITPPIWIEGVGMALMTKIILPVTYGLCSLSLVVRAASMLKSKGSAQASFERVEFLFFAAYTIGATAIAYFWEATHNPGLEVHWSRSLNLVTIYLLVRMITRSQRQAFVVQESATAAAAPGSATAPAAATTGPAKSEDKTKSTDAA